MFNKIIHLLTGMSKAEDNMQVVQESVKLIAENNFLTDITNGRKVGGNVDRHNAMIINGHQKIGDLVQRGINIQKRKIQEEII